MWRLMGVVLVAVVMDTVLIAAMAEADVIDRSCCLADMNYCSGCRLVLITGGGTGYIRFGTNPVMRCFDAGAGQQCSEGTPYACYSGTNVPVYTSETCLNQTGQTTSNTFMNVPCTQYYGICP
jgi:hypothetical protein